MMMSSDNKIVFATIILCYWQSRKVFYFAIAYCYFIMHNVTATNSLINRAHTHIGTVFTESVSVST